MHLPAHCNQRSNEMLTTSLDVGFGEVTCICHQVDRLTQFGRQGLELLKCRYSLLFVVARLHGARGHDQHALHIHGNLTVVALIKSATPDLHDAGCFVGEIDLVFVLHTLYRWNRHLASRELAAFP